MTVTDIPNTVAVRRRIQEFALASGLSLLEQTKLVTAASELLRNMVKYAGHGDVFVEEVQNLRHRGVRITFQDDGPGIPDINRALRDGFSTGNGLGIGLPGARRLVDEFQIRSTDGQGTQIIITKWANR